MTQPLDLHVNVETAPEPGLLRPAIEAALAGRPWPPGPEEHIAAAVIRAMPSPKADRPPPGIRAVTLDQGRGESR